GALVVRTCAQSLSDAQVAAVKQNLATGATKSWELGTRAQALLELDAPAFSVVNASTAVPPATPLNASANASLVDVLTIARNAVVALPSGFASNASGQPLIDGNGSAGDPASLGVAVLLANWTGLQGADYAGAAAAQMRYLLDTVPKTTDGAISHRVSEVQLWSDSVYMVPPFLAYYGVTTDNQSMVQEAYNQIKLYRNYLRDSNGGWRHISLGSFNDTGHWSTGNAWAAAGMLRVFGTMQNSQFSRSFKNQMKDLSNWVFEIQQAMYANLTSSDLFPNYADQPDSFGDASSTALMASTVYRLSLLADRHTFLPLAERTRQTLFAMNASSPPSPAISASTSAVASASATAPASSNTAFASAVHFSSDGWLAPVVNPESFGQQGAASPEGEAFVLMMHSAWRDWVAAGSVGANGAATLRGGLLG
ncbi:Six-hairpin glycosidase-like protein, partial [Vararia minispora EC-137]